MSTTCPVCSGRGLVIWTSQRNQDGQRRRRFACKECGNRWTTAGDGASLRVAPTPVQRMADAVIVEILTTRDANNSEMARRLGIAHQTISAIRLGQLHATVRPDIPRWGQGPTCEQCIHYRPSDEPCDLGFPDPRLEGLGFAAWCSSFHPEEALA